MNKHTREALMQFVNLAAHSVCRCSLAERDSGHRVDCPGPELEEAAHEFIGALTGDETEIG